MASRSKEDAYGLPSHPTSGKVSPLKLAFIATVSALGGGLAVAWWYRDTLSNLRNPVHPPNIQKSGYLDAEFPDVDQDNLEESEPSAPHLLQD